MFVHLLSYCVILLLLQHKLRSLYHCENILLQRLKFGCKFSLLQLVVLDVVAECAVGFRLVYIATISRSGHNLIVGRVEHKRAFVLGLVYSKAVVLIAYAEYRHKCRHDVYLIGKLVYTLVLHTRTKYNERYMIIRLGQFARYLAHQFAMVGKYHKYGVVVP